MQFTELLPCGGHHRWSAGAASLTTGLIKVDKDHRTSLRCSGSVGQYESLGGPSHFTVSSSGIPIGFHLPTITSSSVHPLCPLVPTDINRYELSDRPSNCRVEDIIAIGQLKQRHC